MENKNCTEIAKKIFNQHSYWHKIDLIGVKEKHPEIYEEVILEMKKLQEEENRKNELTI